MIKKEKWRKSRRMNRKWLISIPFTILMLASTVSRITVWASPEGPFIDIYTQKEPYSGRGLNQPSDAFAPDEKFILYADVTYNMAPVSNKFVAYVVSDPEGNHVATGTVLTDVTGIARVSFTLPPVFGTWSAIAVVEIAGQIVNDTLTFRVGWIVEIVSLSTINENLQPQTEFGRGSCVGVELVIRNIAMISKNVTLTVVAHDNSTAPMNSLVLNDFKVNPGETHVPIYCELQIPKWAVVGLATVSANAYTAPLALGGKPYCPEVSARFLITSGRNVSVISVTPSASEVYVREIVNIIVVVKNQGSKTETFNVTAYYNTTAMETQIFTDLIPGTQRTLTYSWNTSGVLGGNYTISAVASPVPEEIDVEDNTYVNGIVTVMSPQPVSAFPRELLILGLLVAAAIIVTIAAILLWRKRSKKSSSPSLSWALRALLGVSG